MSANYKISVDIGARGANQTASQLGKVDAAMNNLGASAKTTGGMFTNVFAGNVAANAVATVTSAMVAGASATLEYSARLEQTKVGFETLMGSAQAAQKHLDELQQFAKSTPFEFAGLAKLSQRLQGVGVETQKVLPLINDIGNAVAAVGGGSEQVEGVTVAISQMISKGKVSAEEMEQLAERQVNGWAMLSAELGISQGAVRKLASEGKISTDVFLKAFQNFSKANFGDAMEKQSKTFNGALSNIKDSVQISAATAFEPLFAKVRVLAVDMAKDIEAQNGDFEKIGVVIAEYVGKGFALGVEAVAGTLGGYLGNRISGILSGEAVIDPITKAVAVGFLDGIGKAIGSATTEKKFTFKFDSDITGGPDKVFVPKPVNEYTKALDKLKASWKEALAAADETKLKRQKELMLDTARVVQDLGLQIAFFGDETEEAAIRQQLLTRGVTDFDSGLAKNAVSLARQLDALKATKKEQEDLTDKTKDFYSKLDDFSASALDFFPQTELDKFDRWLGSLDSRLNNIKATAGGVRNQLQAAFDFKKMLAGFEVFGTLDTALDTLIKDTELETTRISALEQSLLGLARSANVTSNSNFKLNKFAAIETTDLDLMKLGSKYLKDLTANTEKYRERLEQLKLSVQAGVSGQDLDIFYSTFSAASAKSEAEIKGKFKDFLRTLRTTVVVEGKAVEQALFATENHIEAFIAKVEKLGATVKKNELQQGLVKLDEIFERLGLRIGNVGAKTDLEKFNKEISDPAITAAIKARAAQLNYTAEQLERVLRLMAENAADPRSKGTRPRIVGEPEKPTPGFGATVGAGLKDEFGLGNVGAAIKGAQDEMAANAAATKAVYQDLGMTVVDVFGSMAGAAENALANFILTGEGGAAAFASLAASAIANLAIQSGIKALFEYAEAAKETALALASAAVGDAAGAALHTAAAGAHASAGAMYAAIGGGAAAVGIGIGLAGGLSGGKGKNKDQSDQPDYQTNKNSNVNTNSDSSNIRQTNGNIGADATTRKLLDVISGLREEVGGLRNIVQMGKPGDFLERAISQKKGLMSETVIGELKSDSTKVRKMGNALNLT